MYYVYDRKLTLKHIIPEFSPLGSTKSGAHLWPFDHIKNQSNIQEAELKAFYSNRKGILKLSSLEKDEL